MRSPGPGGRAPVLAFNGVMYEDELYPTALHLFEALKFYEHRPDIADRIRECARVEDVAVISAQYEPDTRRDWGNIALMKMDEVLYYKFRQHGDLRNLLLDTYPADLVYSEPGDHFWGDGAGAGRNELGNSLVRVRERLRNEGGG
ncbi:DUF1768-domain-containing protein [Gloeopeniophorella convolvens]|nr:DUF1768-domain-containing protein [Gloeopeniophorella convolvens]